MGANGIIGYSPGNPYRTFRARTLTLHLHYPGLIGIAYRKGFSFRTVAIRLHKSCHHLYRLACSSGTLQGNINKRTVINQTRRIDHFFTAPISGLANGYLKLVNVTNHVISFSSLRNFSMKFMCIPVYYLTHLAFGMLARSIMSQTYEHSIIVSIITANHGTVGRGFLSDNKIGTGHGFQTCQQEKRKNCLFFHLLHVFIRVSYREL